MDEEEGNISENDFLQKNKTLANTSVSQKHLRLKNHSENRLEKKQLNGRDGCLARKTKTRIHTVKVKSVQ